MIEHITLRNFKAFRQLSLPVGRLTLLSGLNGTGKSTILQALGLLRQSADAGLASEGWLLNGEFVELGMGRDVMHEDADSSHIEIVLRESGAEQRWQAEHSAEGDLLKLRAFEGVPGRLFAPSFQMIRADRVNPLVYYPKSYRMVAQRRSLGSRGEYTAHFLAVHQDDEVPAGLRHPARPHEPTLLGQVSAWMQELSPGVSISVHDIKNTDFVRLSYSYGTAGLTSSNAYRPTNVGFGLTYTLPIIVACLASPPGSLVLLENPEAHLHPRGQVAMAQLMGAAVAHGVQILVESHSDHILNGIRLAVKKEVVTADKVQLHFFFRDGKRPVTLVESPRVRPDGRLSAWPDGFFDQWDRSLTELLD